jgi:hypothetical protein
MGYCSCTVCTFLAGDLVHGLVVFCKEWWAWVVDRTRFGTSWYITKYMNIGLYARLGELYRLYRLYRTFSFYARAPAHLSAPYKRKSTAYPDTTNSNLLHEFLPPSTSALSSIPLHPP